MVYNLGALITAILALSSTTSYVAINKQSDHFRNLNSFNYVLAIFVNSSKSPQLVSELAKPLEKLEDSKIIKDNKVLIELIDTSNIPFFNKHYKLEGKNGAKLFIRNQMIDYDGFDNEVNEMIKQTLIEYDLPVKLLTFVDSGIKGISHEIRDLEHFRGLMNSKRILGYFCCSDDNNFEQYFKVASKNIDFTFVHTFDDNLNRAIFKEISTDKPPKSPFFSIIRHEDLLNEFDKNKIVTFTDFSEKNLTEFIEFERFDKLRDPSTGNSILKRMFSKAQPLLLYIKANADNSENFDIFRESVKSLPKRFIYSYTDLESENMGPFLQLFMMADKMMSPDTLSIVWVSPDRKVRIESYNGALEKDRIIEFVFKFQKQNESIFDSMREHLYDKEGKVIDEEITSEEL